MANGDPPTGLAGITSASKIPSFCFAWPVGHEQQSAYCPENTHRPKAMGVSDGEIAELIAVIDFTNGLNKVWRAAQVKPEN